MAIYSEEEDPNVEQETISNSKKVDALVGGRFTEKELNNKLSVIFGERIEGFIDPQDGTKEELPELDNLFCFSVDGEEIDIDLFFIRTNAPNVMYITETCVNSW